MGNILLYRDDEPRLELVEYGRPWGCDGDGALFRLVSEAQRIRLAYLFDPYSQCTPLCWSRFPGGLQRFNTHKPLH